MRLRSALVASVLCASAFVIPTGCFADTDKEPIPTGLTGKWEAYLYTQQGNFRKVWQIEKDGKYTMTAFPMHGGDAFGNSGTVKFSNGECSLDRNGTKMPSVQYHQNDSKHLALDTAYGVAQWTKADDVDSAAKFNSQFTEAKKHNNNGVGLGTKGKWEEALQEHYKACYEDPTNMTFRTNLSAAHLQYARVLLDEKKTESATEHFQQAIFVDPMNQEAISELDKLRGQ